MMLPTVAQLARVALAGKAQVPKISDQPEYIAWKAKVDAAPTLAAKLAALGTQDGFYSADPTNPTMDTQARVVLARIALEDALIGVANGQDVANVLTAALQGVPDNKDYGILVPTGANIQDLCGTTLDIEGAMDVLAHVDADAGKVVGLGIGAAVPAKFGDYKALLAANFKKRFGEVVSGVAGAVANSLSPILVAAGVGLALVVAFKVMGRKRGAA